MKDRSSTPMDAAPQVGGQATAAEPPNASKAPAVAASSNATLQEAARRVLNECAIHKDDEHPAQPDRFREDLELLANYALSAGVKPWKDCVRCGAAYLLQHPEADPAVIEGALQSASGDSWVSVKDRLPSNDNLMLVAYRPGIHARPDRTIRKRPWSITVARHAGGQWRFVMPSQKSRLSERVYFWQPLPDYPDATT